MKDALDRSKWRRLKKRAHPDGGGSDDLMAWVTDLEKHVEALENRKPQVVAPMFGPGGVTMGRTPRAGYFDPSRMPRAGG